MTAPTTLVRGGDTRLSNVSTVELRRPETECVNTRPGLTHQIDSSDWRAEMHSTRRCSVDGCDRTHYGKGLCTLHYQRQRNTGTTSFRRKTAEERFWAKVTPTGFCWEWASDGYGRFYVNGGLTGAHRFAYEVLVGPIPAGMVLDHLCRNSRCVNPDHLEPVTMGENTRRGTHWVAGNLGDTRASRRG